MLQVVQHQRSGVISVEKLPVPVPPSGWILVRNAYSLISSGTERTSVQKAQSSLAERAMAQPDAVRTVVDLMRRDGIISTAKKVLNKLDTLRELGYSTAGVVVESCTPEFAVGDHVACAGSSANHAEYVIVPKNLAVRVLKEIPLSEAACTTLGSIALQGIRQSKAQLGETVAVIGLGLIGLITVQMLKAAGCRVIGFDISDANFALASSLGCEAVKKLDSAAVDHAESFSSGRGIDAALLTASTSSNAPVEMSIKMARKKGRIVVVGAVGMNIPRSPFYEKELEFTISCSYGPGRYDPRYEVEGYDYPLGYVRWTERRNMEAVIEMLQAGTLSFAPLISHTFMISKALDAYKIVSGKKKEQHLGILLQYPQEQAKPERLIAVKKPAKKLPAEARKTIGFIGAGSFAQANLLPHILKNEFRFKTVVNATAVSAKSVAVKFGFENAATDPYEVLNDDTIGTVFIATRHETHAEYVVEALKKGKAVFVEKPLAINTHQLEQIRKVLTPESVLMVGYNRRYSAPMRHIKKIISVFAEPKQIVMRINAGFIPLNHWVHDPKQGGRVIGEVCHFVDTAQFLTGSEIVSVQKRYVESANEQYAKRENLSILLGFTDGSVCTIQYITNGSSKLYKEHFEIHTSKQSLVLEDFKKLTHYHKATSETYTYDGTKGHREEMNVFLDLIGGKKMTAVKLNEILQSAGVTIDLS